MIRPELTACVLAAVRAAQAAGDLPDGAVPAFDVAPPKDVAHGDLAANAALVMAKTAKLPPRKVAEILVRHLDATRFRPHAPLPAEPLPEAGLTAVSIEGPGFINFRIGSAWLHETLRAVLTSDDAFGRSDAGAGRSVLVEYVSANPTGPLHAGTGRNAAVGDVLANLLAFGGHAVSREYYVNDFGNQVESLARSVDYHYLRAFERPAVFPEDGYQGAYVEGIAAAIVARDAGRWLDRPEDERLDAFRAEALERLLADIRETLEQFGVRFDRWFSERSLHESGAVARTVRALVDAGHAYEKEGAIWFAAERFGDDKDRVLVRADGRPTYFAADIPYHLDKFSRGFDRLVDVWGVDHIGDVARVRGGLRAAGADPDRLDILIHQHVRFKSGADVVRMSKRSGGFIELRDVVDEVGRDAARFFFVMSHYSNPMDFDFELAKAQSQDNPVYYVQYAHARMSGILREAERLGRRLGGVDALTPLAHPAELALIHKIAEFPEVVALAAARLEPHKLCTYGHELAEAFHAFYTQCRVLVDEEDVAAARASLLLGARIALRNTLHLLGVAAPDRM
ncbi:MAG: arginine--tRNA ligase [Armatimonadetes bacterium]|nr:arginine--tRNA ligase [Armatimonadota bacterium]